VIRKEQRREEDVEEVEAQELEGRRPEAQEDRDPVSREASAQAALAGGLGGRLTCS
jgi:hypothetical protein